MYSEKFQDIYFHPEEGLQESLYVFIDGNNLQERFKHNENFSICELGFGTGLNFLLTAKIFLEKNAKGMLFYYSIEGYPLLPYQIEHALRKYSEISSELSHLLQLLKLIYYPTKGFQTIFFHSRIRLTLLLGDVIEMLKVIPENTKFDAWYLDGFAPSKNPEMWREEVFQEMAKHSYKNTTFSTFTCARVVKDGLKKANFTIYKRKGFKQKREMLFGFFHKPIVKNSTYKKTIAIVGAGISGTTTALQLLKRNHNVLLFDQNENICEAASAIPSAILMPYISSQINIISSYSIKGYNTFISFLYNFLGKEFYEIFKKNIIILKHSYMDKLYSFIQNYNLPPYIYRKFKDSFVSSRGGILNTNQFKLKLKEKLYTYSHLRFYPKTKIIDLKIEEERLLLIDHTQCVYDVDHLIFCIANGMESFSLLKPIEFFPVRGQLVYFKNPFPYSLKSMVSDISLYQIQDSITIGSSYENYKRTLERDRGSDEFLLKKLETYFPTIFPLIAKNHPIYEYKIPTEAFIGIRCQSKDYFPCVGNVVNWKKFIEDLNSLKPNRRYYYKDISVPVYPHIWLNSCHGSRGYTTSFLSSEIISSLINNDPVPLEHDFIQQCSPARFLFRKWRASQNRKIFNLE